MRIIVFCFVLSSISLDLYAIRNPFIFETQPKIKMKKSSHLTLVGIVACQGTKCAVLEYGDESYVLHEGQSCQGYTIAFIGANHIIVHSGNKKKELYLT